MRKYFIVLLVPFIFSACATTNKQNNILMINENRNIPIKDYSKQLLLNLSLADNNTLNVQLINISQNNVTCRVSTVTFEGTFMISQANKAPVQVCPKDYYKLLQGSPWKSTLVVLEPKAIIKYSIPFNSLIPSLKDININPSKSFNIFAKLKYLSLTSNSIKASLPNDIAAQYEMKPWRERQPVSRSLNYGGFSF